MKTQVIIAVSLLALSSAYSSAYAHGEHKIFGTLESRVIEVVYDTPAYNRGIHSYPNLVPAAPFAQLEMIYMDQAAGQAIYSYPSAGQKQTVSFSPASSNYRLRLQ